MTCLWDTCSNAGSTLGAVLLLWLSAVCANAATITGSVDLVDSREAAVSKAGNRSGVVLWLQRAEQTTPIAVDAPARANLVQKRKLFTPHVLAVQMGTEVNLPNYDPIFHNAFSTFDGQVFDVGLYPPGTTRTVHFRREGVVRVFCNIHPTMSAVIVVVPSPWFGTTAAAGTWEISGVPEGEYRLSVFHERATPRTLAALSRRISVTSGNDKITVPNIVISESGYLPVPHKNKYGRDYDPAAERSYIGVR